MDFTGFPRATLEFLQDLAANNNREWFKANKQRYERAYLDPALACVVALGDRLEAISPQFLAEAKKSGGSLMRIYRDVRFSKDKAPYKTNIGIWFKHAASGGKPAPGYYVHLDADGMFLGLGLYRPPTKVLTAIRTSIVEDPVGWVAARDDAAFRAACWELGGESLKRAPRGFDADHPLVDDLKRKSFIGSVRGEAEQALRGDFADWAAERFAAAAPFMAWLCGAVGVPY